MLNILTSKIPFWSIGLIRRRDNIILNFKEIEIDRSELLESLSREYYIFLRSLKFQLFYTRGAEEFPIIYSMSTLIRARRGKLSADVSFDSTEGVEVLIFQFVSIFSRETADADLCLIDYAGSYR